MARWRLATIVLVGLLAAGAGLKAQSYVPNRVFDSATGQFSDFEAMLATLAGADVVFVGEQHDDPNTHRLERAILEGLLRRRRDVVLSLEMFERDVQARLDEFRAGRLTEEAFVAASRPWPRYTSDYKPLVDMAVAHTWPVIAANIPRPIASAIAKSGIEVLSTWPEAERPWYAAEWTCPTDDEYYRRFKEEMGAHPSAAELERYYFSQCLKDETMAESVARAWRDAAAATPGARPLVVHYDGAFHSDYGLGTAARTRRRLPEAKTIVVSVIPVANLDNITLDDHRGKGDYLVFTIGK